MPSEVVVRLGSHAEKEYLLKTINLFSGMIVGANLLESTPGATVSLAWKVKTLGKTFYIDPMTYVFGIDLDYISSDTINKKTGQVTRDLKRSFKSICRQLEGPFSTVVIDGRRSLSPMDFGTEYEVAELCDSVLKYQINRMAQICELDPQLKEVANQASPSGVLSPYFYVPGANEALSSEWEDLTLRLIDSFGTLDTSVPKYAVLCFSRRTLKDRVRISRFLERIMRSGCSGCWFWVSALREEDITEAEIANLVLLAKQAKQNSFPLWNMHGGFLSALLSRHGLSGFSHGIGYGESKDVLPVSGGAVPTVAYHFNPLHVRSSVPDIERAFSSIGVIDASSFHEIVCNCIMCRGTLKGDLRNFRKYGELVLKAGNIRQSQTTDSAKRCRFHFLLARKQELDFVNQDIPLGSLIATLRGVVSEYRSLGYQIKLRDKAGALEMWTSAI